MATKLKNGLEPKEKIIGMQRVVLEAVGDGKRSVYTICWTDFGNGYELGNHPTNGAVWLKFPDLPKQK